MANKKKLLKNLLTTASAVSVLAIGAGDALAAVQKVSVNNPSAFANAADWLPAAAIADGDQIVTTAVKAITVDANKTVTLNENAVGAALAINVGANTLGIAGTAGGAFWDIQATNAASKVVLGLNGVAQATFFNQVALGNYSGIRSFDANNQNGASFLVQSDNAVVSTNFTDTTANNTGLIVVDAANATFTGTFAAGGAAFGALKINDGKSAIMDTNLVLNGALTLGNGNGASANLTINDGKNVTVHSIAASLADKSVLTFVGASTLQTTNAAGIGNVNKLSAINIGTGAVTGGANLALIKATNINFTDAADKSAGALVLGAAANTAVIADLKNTSGTDARGTFTFGAAAGNNATLTTNVIGAAGARIGAIRVGGNDQKLAVVAGAASNNVDVYVANVDSTSLNEGTVTFKADNINLHGGWTVASGKNPIKVVQILETKAGGAPATVTMDANATLAAVTLDLAGAAFDNKLYLSEGSVLNVEHVSSANANNGSIFVKGSSTITGAIDATLGKIKDITFDTDGKTLTVGGSEITINGAIAFNHANTTLTLTHTAANVTVDAAGDITVNGANSGNINADAVIGAGKTVTLKNNVGDFANGKAINSISAQGGIGGTLEFDGGDVFVNNLNIGGHAQNTLLLSSANNYKITNLIHAAGDGIIKVVNNVTIAEGSVLSAASDKMLNNVLISGVAKTLTLQDGVNVYAANGITSDTANNAILVLQGDHQIGTTIGTTTIAFDHIDVTAGKAGKKSALLQDVVLKNAISLTDNDAYVQLGGNVTAKDIAAFAAGKGTVEFVNANAVKLTGTIGQTANAAMANVIFSGKGDVEITGKVSSAGGLQFGKDSAGTVTFDDSAGIDAMAITTAANNTNSLVLKHKAVVNFAAAVGATANTINSITIDSTNAGANTGVTVANKTFYVNNLLFAKGSTNDVVLNTANTAGLNNIGSANASAKSLDFQAAGITVGGAVYSDTTTFTNSAQITGGLTGADATVFSQQTATLGGTVTVANGIKLQGVKADAAATQLVLLDGVTLNKAVIGGNANAGDIAKNIVTFKGGATVNADITAGSTTFAGSASQKVTLATSNIKSDAIVFGASPVTVATNIGLTGASATNATITATGSTMDFLTSTATLGAKSILTFNGATKLATTYDGSTTAYGHIVTGAANNSKIAFAAGSTLNVSITDNNADLPSTTPQEVLLLVDTDANVDVSALKNTIAVTQSLKNSFVNWTYSGNGLKFNRTNNAAGALAAIVDAESAGVFGDASVTGDAQNYQKSLAAIAGTNDANAANVIKDSVNRIELVEGIQNESIQAFATVGGEVARRADTAALPTALEVSQHQGVAAGDDSSRYGVWGSPFYTQGTQKASGSAPKYVAKAAGMTVGFDTLANDTMTVGAAVSFINNRIKFKGSAAGDKTTANTYMISVYGVQQLTDNWFIRAIASFGSTNVKNKAKRITSLTGSQVATGKYDSMTYGIDGVVGYNIQVADTAAFTPMAGLRYTKFNDSGYKETGTSFQNRSISKKSFDKIEGILGARAVFAMDASNGIVLNPEIHGFLNYDFKAKKQTVNVTLDGLNSNVPTVQPKATKALFNIGAGVDTKYSVMHYGVTLDSYIAKKYTALQASLKLRVDL